MSDENKYVWLKTKGYLHIMPRINVAKRKEELISKITNPEYIAKHAFFPLIHSNIKQRKYKKIPNTNKRAHSYRKDDHVVHTAKIRPLHYASNFDALIFGYYAELLQDRYENSLRENSMLSDCIIAYRKIKIDESDKGKSTIHFAKEVFDEIKLRAENRCSVLMFDIKSFFSEMDHEKLRDSWLGIIGEKEMPLDHENVFNATANFSYILKDDLRLANEKKERKKAGFDEKRLSEIRKSGKFSFFESPLEFRQKIKSGEIKIFRHPFRNKVNKKPIGIPQGLAISAVLANLYLLDFDKAIFNYVVENCQGYYRRYSDDILIICDPSNVNDIKDYVLRKIKDSLVEISQEKTEEYLFEKVIHNSSGERITSIKIINGNNQIGVPLTYLGFEFYGYKTLIKSANLSKFYRRMIQAVKTKADRARKLSKESPNFKFAVFRRQLYRLYILQDLDKTKIRKNYVKLVQNNRGYYDTVSIERTDTMKSNYLSYVKRASEIMDEPAIKHQIRKHKKIFNDAIKRHLIERKE